MKAKEIEEDRQQERGAIKPHSCTHDKIASVHIIIDVKTKQNMQIIMSIDMTTTSPPIQSKRVEYTSAAYAKHPRDLNIDLKKMKQIQCVTTNYLFDRIDNNKTCPHQSQIYFITPFAELASYACMCLDDSIVLCRVFAFE